jgi:hypothetical protein
MQPNDRFKLTFLLKIVITFSQVQKSNKRFLQTCKADRPGWRVSNALDSDSGSAVLCWKFGWETGYPNCDSRGYPQSREANTGQYIYESIVGFLANPFSSSGILQLNAMPIWKENMTCTVAECQRLNFMTVPTNWSTVHFTS